MVDESGYDFDEVEVDEETGEEVPKQYYDLGSSSQLFFPQTGSI